MAKQDRFKDDYIQVVLARCLRALESAGLPEASELRTVLRGEFPPPFVLRERIANGVHKARTVGFSTRLAARDGRRLGYLELGLLDEQGAFKAERIVYLLSMPDHIHDFRSTQGWKTIEAVTGQRNRLPTHDEWLGRDVQLVVDNSKDWPFSLYAGH